MRALNRGLRLLVPVLFGAALLAASAAADEPAKPVAPPKAAAPVKPPKPAKPALRSDPEASPDQAERRAALDDARHRLAEAANDVARLSAGLYGGERHVRMLMAPFGDRKVMLGVLIGGDADGKGVPVAGVTPAGPAEQAGLREEDVIVRIDDVDLAADTVEDSLQRMTDHLADRGPGDEVELEVLRGGDHLRQRVALRPPTEFNYKVGPGEFPPGMPFLGGPHNAMFYSLLGEGAFADLELVSLTPGLGRYFGTEKGLLVVRAPKDAKLGLEDGDVILEIGGRSPQGPSHAIRILSSYDKGESVSLRIQRSGSPRTLDVKL